MGTIFALFIGPQIRFQLSEYIVLESGDSVEVCVELVGGPLNSNTDVQVQTQSATALGKSQTVATTSCLRIT